MTATLEKANGRTNVHRPSRGEDDACRRPEGAVKPASPQADLAAALLDPQQPCSPDLRAWNGSDPAARLAVYRNNVVSSLIDALAETFPVVQALVGVDFFRAMASVFVRRSPPRSRVLAHYGEGFAVFVEGFEPAASVPYLADVARLEMARVRAYHAADADPVEAEAVQRALACGDRLGQVCLSPHPSVSIVDSRYAVVSLWAAHQADGDLAAVDPDVPESALVLRSRLDVIVLRIPRGAARFIAALLDGLALAPAVAAVDDAADDFDLAQTLPLLLAHGALTDIRIPEELSS